MRLALEYRQQRSDVIRQANTMLNFSREMSTRLERPGGELSGYNCLSDEVSHRIQNGP